MAEERSRVAEALVQAEETAAFHGEMLQAMATQIAALRQENASLKARLAERGGGGKPYE